jgi:23S rRNA (uracil1939-C5)-methyltransferase
MNKRTKPAAPKDRATLDVTIESIGHKGDGVAVHEGRALYVPFTVAGDRARVRIEGERGELQALLKAGTDRAEPPCVHFGDCGGCALQHVSPPAYAEWKRTQVVTALAQRGFGDMPVEPCIVLPPRVRRRLVAKALRTSQTVVLGFNRRATHQLIDVRECVIASPNLVRMFPELRDVLSNILPVKAWAKIALTESDAGVDCAFESETKLALPGLQALADFAEAQDLARVSWNGDPVAERRAPFVTFADSAVKLPPKSFLQASRAADEALTRLVLESIDEPRHVADLFCGLGTFALPLATGGRRVHAYDSDAASIASLQSAARANGLSLEAAARDLFRRPLSEKELNGFDAVVFDPPRAGAIEQAQALAASGVPRVVAVSCSPASFARDARVLVDGGYRLMRVTPVDQFLWSAHVELVAAFSR